MIRWLINFLLIALLSTTPAVMASEAQLVEDMQAGNVVLMIRHALAPGVGDPDEFDVNDCSTQRNLSDEGRAQARSIGDWLRSKGIDNARVYSSQWCRCMETAELMNVGEVKPLTPLNSFFEQRHHQQRYLSDLRTFIKNNTSPGELIIMVTHQVTISGITGKWTDSGHGKLVRPNEKGQIELLGELSF